MSRSICLRTGELWRNVEVPSSGPSSMLFDQNRPISLRLAYQYSRVSPKGERLRNLLSQSILISFASLKKLIEKANFSDMFLKRSFVFILLYTAIAKEISNINVRLNLSSNFIFESDAFIFVYSNGSISWIWGGKSENVNKPSL